MYYTFESLLTKPTHSPINLLLSVVQTITGILITSEHDSHTLPGNDFESNCIGVKWRRVGIRSIPTTLVVRV